MNPKTTRILVTLALGLFAFILLYERRWPDADQRGQVAQKLLPGFDPARVTGIEVVRTNQGALRAERHNGGWLLTVPLQYPAQTTRIESLLDDLAGLTRRGYLSAPELLAHTNGLAEFGLDPPQAKLIVQQEGGPIELHLGAQTLIRDQVYLQVIGSDGVYVCDAGLLHHLPAAANDWRDTTLIRLKTPAYNRLTVRAGPRDFEAQLDPATRVWRLTKPMPARADSLALNTVLSELQQWQITRFVTDNPGADLESFGLQPAEIQLVIGQGTNDLARIHFGRNPPENTNLVYAFQASHTNVVLVPKTLLEVLRDPFNTLRDRHLISVATNTVDRIEIQAAEAFTLRRQPDRTWRVVEPQPFAADATLVHEFLLNLDGLEIREFVKDVATPFDFANYGFAKPTRRYVLQAASTNAAGGATNLTLAQIEFGAEQADRVYVRRADENSVYAVARGDLLPRAAFQLRDRRLWHFTTNDVTRFTVSVRGQTRKFSRSVAGQWTVDTGPAGTPVPLALDEALYRFGRLRADAWVAEGGAQPARYGVPETAHEIAIDVRQGDQSQRLSLQFGRFSPWARPYAAVMLDQQWLVFEFPLDVYLPYQELLRELNLLGSTAARSSP